MAAGGGSPRLALALVALAWEPVALPLPTPSRPHPTTLLFLFNRDSPHMLRAWLDHHVSVLGDARALHVVDHASEDLETRALLDEARAMGVQVTTYHGPFSGKQDALSAVMRARAPQAHLLVPLDVDEFVGVYRRGSYSFRRQDVLGELARLGPTVGQGKRYKFGVADARPCDARACLQASARAGFNMRAWRMALPPRPSAPTSGHRKHWANCLHKTFYPAPVFRSTDQGNHYGTLAEDGPGPFTTEMRQKLCGDVAARTLSFPSAHALVLVHAALAQPFAYYDLKMRRGAAAYNMTGPQDCPKTRQGYHYCRYARQSEAERRALAASYCRAGGSPGKAKGGRRQCVTTSRPSVALGNGSL